MKRLILLVGILAAAASFANVADAARGDYRFAQSQQWEPPQYVPPDVDDDESPAMEPESVAKPLLPEMSDADQAQFKEDAAIFTQPVRIIGDDEGGKKEARFEQCATHWQANLHRNRSQDARRVLLAARIARCMFRTKYALFREREGCKLRFDDDREWWQQGVAIAMQSRCYARF